MDEDRYQMVDEVGYPIHFADSQRRCVDYNSSRTTLVIKGTAGSGKTLMVVKRAKNYREKIIAEGSGKKVQIFTYNRALASGIRHLLEMNGIDSNDPYLNVSTVDSYIATLCRRFNDIMPREESTQRSRGYGRYDQRGRKTDDYRPIENDEERVAIVKEALANLSKSGSDHQYFHRDPEVWADEILWMYRNGIADADDEGRYLTISREGRCKNYMVRLQEKGRRVVMRIFNEYNKLLREKHRFEWERIYALFLREHVLDIDRDHKANYVLVDEAQDMSFVKMSIINYLCLEELNIAMDRNQNLYGHRWRYKDVGLTPHVLKLEVMHRGTKQIDELSSDLKRIDDTLLDEEDHYSNEKSLRDGDLPEVVKCLSEATQLQFIIQEIKGLLKDPVNIAILCLDYLHLGMIRDELTKNGIDCQLFKEDKDFNALTPGVKLITVYSSKGLGFAYVFLPYFEYGVFPKSVESVVRSISRNKDSGDSAINVEQAMAEEYSASRRLLYVAITRAKVHVYLTFTGEPSPFLAEFDPSHYMLVNESHMEIPQYNSVEPLPTIQTRPTLERESMDIPSTSVSGTPSISSGGDDGIQTSAANHPSGDHLQGMDPTVLLGEMGVEFIDKRDKGGVLWMIDDGGTAREAVEILRGQGHIIEYTENSRATGRRPAYYMKR